MSNFIFLDTECTGVDKDDRLIQLAYKRNSDEVVPFNELFKPPVPIKIEAMAVHHITEEMVSQKPVFEGSEYATNLQEVLKDGILVAHNAKFDIEMLAREFVTVPRFICTMRMAQHLDEDAVIPSYSLQYLRYLLKLDVDLGGLVAHDALADVFVLEKLFERLSTKMSVEEMLEVSSKPTLIKRFVFGKYKGQLLKDIAKTDKGYLEWLLSEKKKETQLDEDWVYTLEQYV